MKSISVQPGKRSYNIFIGVGALRMLRFKKYRAQNYVIVADTRLKKHIVGGLTKHLKDSGARVLVIAVIAGDGAKSFTCVGNILRTLAKRNFPKDGVLISVGGGTMGDMVGFVASIYKRGVRYIQIPTTLLAMVDSGIGGKTGVNLPEGKNLVGTIYQSEAVLVDMEYLQSLPEKEIKKGLAEVIKYAIIADRKFFEYLEKNISRRDHDFFEKVITTSCAIKAKVVSSDEHETERRKILNFGHTVGHAIEILSHHHVAHGEAVAIGMMYEIKIAQKLSFMSEKDVARFESLLVLAGLPTQYAFTKNNIGKTIAVMKQDKKNKNEKLYFVLPKKIGSLKREKNIVSFPVNKSLIKIVLHDTPD